MLKARSGKASASKTSRHQHWAGECTFSNSREATSGTGGRCSVSRCRDPGWRHDLVDISLSIYIYIYIYIYNMYISLSLSISLSLYIYIYIYIVIWGCGAWGHCMWRAARGNWHSAKNVRYTCTHVVCTTAHLGTTSPACPSSCLRVSQVRAHNSLLSGSQAGRPVGQ